VFPEECHHGPLKFLANFLNLKEISLVFGKSNLGRSYERRFFEVSEKDLDNLASGLTPLRHLEHFAIRKSKLNNKKKFFDVLLVLKNKKTLKSLDFSYCFLGEEAGEDFKMFFNFNKSLERLELQGNFLGPVACEAFGIGLAQFLGSLKYLGL
jgi:hypothetical protein